MTTIKIPKTVDDTYFNKILEIWNKNSNISLVFPKRISTVEIENLIHFFLSKPKSDLSLTIISNLIEYPNISNKILEKVFELNDIGCSVSICLRNDLSESLKNKCMNSPMLEISQHYKNNT